MTSDRTRLLLTAYPPDGGVARQVIDLAEGAADAGWKVEVACPGASEQWSILARRGDVKLHRLHGNHGEPTPGDAAAIPQLVSLVRGIGVVHAHSAKAGFLTRFAAALAGARGRTIFSPHAWSFWSAGGAEQRLYLQLERAAARWCRTIVAVSAAEKAAGVRAGVGRADAYRVILNGVDTARFARPPEPVAGRVLFVGRLARQKRPDLALRAFARVHASRPDARLDLVGDGPLRGEIQALVDALDLRKAVRFLGARGDVPALLASAQCLLLTSDYEGCPYTVLEAMAAGVPVVATRVGGVPELVTERTGILVPRDDVAATAAAVDRLLADETLARRLGSAGRETARASFSSDRMVTDTLALYEAIAGS